MLIALYCGNKTHLSILIYIRERKHHWHLLTELEQSAKGTKHRRSDVCATEI